jgi:hypothetical protein
MVSGARWGLGDKGGAGVRLDTQWPASSAHPRCRARATCVPGPGHCEVPAGRRGRSSVRGCGASSRGVDSSPVDHRREGKKSFCCVTTRRRKFWALNSLRRGLGPLAARSLGLGVPSFDVGGLAMSSLALRRLPASDLPLAVWILAVALVPTPRQVLASTAFAQADPRARSASSGRTAVFSRTLTSAHGRCFSQGKSSGRMSHHSPRALSQRERDAGSPVYRLPRNKTKNETAFEMRFRRRHQDRRQLWWRSPNDRKWRQNFVRYQTGRLSSKRL